MIRRYAPRCPLIHVARHFTVVVFISVLFGVPVFASASEWLKDGNGLWNDPSAWSGSVPNSPGATARFPIDRPTTDATIDLEDLGATIGSLEYLNPWKLTVLGNGPLFFDQPGGIGFATIQLHPGDLHIFAPIVLSGGTLAAIAVDSDSLIRIDGVISGVGSFRVHKATTPGQPL